MTGTARFAAVAALAGDIARAEMLHALLDGRALTASELARVAGITPQTASAHLGRMVDAGLLSVLRQGRHRYHRLASAEVARMLESMMQVACAARPPAVVGPRDAALRAARTCYDHLAGRLGVALADGMQRRGLVELGEDAGLLTAHGSEVLAAVGVALAGSGGRRARPACRPCLDWSERRVHLAGSVASAICAHGLAHGWLRRVPGSRAVRLLSPGRAVFCDHLGVDPVALQAP